MLRERNYLPIKIEQYRLNELRFKAEIDEYKGSYFDLVFNLRELILMNPSASFWS